MAIGPVQLLVLGFDQPDFHGEIIEELEKLRESDTVRVIDALAVYKDSAGEMEVMHLSNLSKEEAIEFGSKVAALIGLGIEGEEGFEKGAELGAEMGAEGIHAFSDEEAWDVLEEIPNDSRGGADPARAPLGGAAARRDRSRRRYRPCGLLHPSCGSRRARPRHCGGGRGARGDAPEQGTSGLSPRNPVSDIRNGGGDDESP